MEEEVKRLMSEQRATRDSYSRHHPMPETKGRMQVSQTFTDEEYQRMQMGTIPQEMEDKWFIYFEDGWFFFHRSWTGICIYQVRLEPDDSGWSIVEAWVNADPTQFSAPEDTQQFLRIIRYVLLG